MKTKALWMLTVILSLSGLSLSSCTDMADNPVEPSAVDEGVWNINDEDMDASVQVGDDFFMHVNGGWWKNTELGDEDLVGSIVQLQEHQFALSKALPSGPAAKAFTQLVGASTEKYATAKEELEQAIARVNNTETTEELWKLMAQLMQEGYLMPIGMELLSKNGQPAVFFGINQPEFSKIESDDEGDDDEGDDDDIFAARWGNIVKSKTNSLQLQLLRNPDLIRSLQPVVGGSTTRGFSDTNWPMLLTICQELGIDPERAYLPADLPGIGSEGLDEIFNMQMFLSEMQNVSVDELKELMVEYLKSDTPLTLSKDEQSMDERLEQIVNLLKFTNKSFAYEEAQLYAEAYVTPEMIDRTMDFCEQLRTTFAQRIERNTWISSASKANVQEKLQAMNFYVGAPTEWLEEGTPDMSQVENLLDGVQAARQAHLALTKKILDMPIEKAGFHILLASGDVTLNVVNAFYMPAMNSMFILPAWMMEPAYDETANSAINYALLTIFGHEITHGFDSDGSQFDKNGDLGSIWASEADEMKFKELSQQLVECYSAFEVMPDELPGVYNDGEYTLAENIADLGGMELAYETYTNYLMKNGFWGDELTLQQQRFFQAYAHLWQLKYSAEHAKAATMSDDPDEKDEHSLARERVNGVVMNMDSWYDVFNLKSGKLYRTPAERIHIW